jgi:hypothetical protein
MPKTGLIAGFLALTLAAACVPAADPAAKSSSFLPDSGLPADAVVKLLFMPDVASYPDLFILTYLTDKVSTSQIAAAPAHLCRSIRKRLVFQEFMAQEPDHLRPTAVTLKVRCL